MDFRTKLRVVCVRLYGVLKAKKSCQKYAWAPLVLISSLVRTNVYVNSYPGPTMKRYLKCVCSGRIKPEKICTLASPVRNEIKSVQQLPKQLPCHAPQKSRQGLHFVVSSNQIVKRSPTRIVSLPCLLPPVFCPILLWPTLWSLLLSQDNDIYLPRFPPSPNCLWRFGP